MGESDPCVIYCIFEEPPTKYLCAAVMQFSMKILVSKMRFETLSRDYVLCEVKGLLVSNVRLD